MLVRELITASGLEIIDTVNISESIELITADYRLEEITICKYIFLSGDYNFYKENIVNKEKYKLFEEKFVEPVFFNIAGDLSWNLYLVYVLSDSEYKKLPLDEIIEFEKDERFARKIVVSSKSFLKYIPVGRVVKSESGSYIVDPVTEWMTVLETNNMTFCLEPFSTFTIQSFLSGNIQPEANIDSLPDDANKSLGNGPLKIKSLNINGNFRRHCFNSNSQLEFGDVNLLSGANGSGKTSVLEAMELIMTGEIRKNSKGIAKGELYENDLHSKSTFELTNGKEVSIPFNSKVKKERESTLYQNRQKKKDNLNGAFHQYNYYTFEDIYTFCFLGQQPNYNNEFSKIIFGESTKSIEKNWLRYREAFQKEVEEIGKNLEYLNGEIKLLGQFGNVDLQFSLTPFYKLLEGVKIAFEKVNNESDYEFISSWLTELYTKSLSIKMLLENYLAESNGIDSKTRIKQVYESEIAKQTKTNELLAIVNKNINEINSTKDLINQQINEVNSKKDEVIKSSTSINKSLNIFNSYALAYNAITDCNLLIDYEDGKVSLQQKVYILREFNERWGDLVDVQVIDITALALKKQLEDLDNKKRDLFEKLVEVQKRIEVEENKNETISNVISRVKVLGINYFNESAESSKCPLCGTGFDSRADFMRAINEELFIDDINYKKMLEEKDSLQANFDANEKSSEVYKKQQEHIKDFLNAIDFMLENSLISVDENLKSASTLKMKEKISEVVKLFQEESDRLKNLNFKINNFKLKGIELSFVTEFLEYINLETESHDKYLVIKKILTVKDNLEKLSAYYAAETLVVNSKHKKLSEVLDIELDKLRKASAAKQSLYEDLQVIEVSIQKIDSLKKYISEIEQFNINIDADTPISKVKNFLQTILDENGKLSEIIAKIINRNEKLTKQTAIRQEIALKEQDIARGVSAVDILDRLRLSEQYAEEFIKNNINDISNLFITLHSPREFDKLDLNTNDEIVGFRKSSNTDIEVPIYMMSTGQRTAVVLSIFIKLHLSMRTAPKFILLDEPVSNIDDLNILGLLDFLREMAISNGTQIFFTTANHNVAKLFKRKFGFLRDGFCEFKFMRFGNTKSKILRYTYNEYQDNNVSEMTVLE